ncbi:MAG: hypothetical protein O2887_09255 [Bacteroidetes bacterium]|nr:hypothetical protein [Bacteroidota bacterium]MDA1120659.1 hypothetical protein [Bacteroidota bacterium]
MIRLNLFLLVAITGCATFKPHKPTQWEDNQPQSVEIKHSIFISSGIGNPDPSSLDLISNLKLQLNEASGNATHLLIGNLVPKSGLPDSSNLAKISQYEDRLIDVVDFINKFPGKSIIIPGYNEWAQGRQIGYNAVNDFQIQIEKTFNNENLVLPANGCPGPVEIVLNDNTILLVIDTQWWFQNNVNQENSSCEIKSKGDFIVALNDAVKRNYDKQIIVSGYHPMYSDGQLSGHFRFASHLTPPIFGSLFVFYKRLIGDADDVSNLSYKIFSGIVQRIFRDHPNLIYVSTGEKSLQYFDKANVKHILAGSFSKPTATINKDALFSYGKAGFSRIDQYTNGEVWLTYWVQEETEITKAYSVKLYDFPNSVSPTDADDLPKFVDQKVSASSTIKHHKKKNKIGLSGMNYRREWEQMIENVPVFDIETEKGGLVIIQRGGGQQTRSLRLEDKTGKQWVLRSVEKYPSNALPLELRGTVIDDFVTDQVSASHPYGALVVPPLAEAVGVHHTNPRLVYLPDDPRLGIYREDFAEGLYLFEERPANKDWGDASFFGNPDDIINTMKLIEKMQDNGNHHPDQRQIVRSRLFDVVIGDWDRHDDQWRWAKFNQAEKYGEKIDLYQPIPRDRDQAFFRGDGPLLKLGSHRWGQPKFQGFYDQIRDVEGLAFNARYFDRYFITEADWNLWNEEAQFIQSNLTDDIIESAIRSWPKEIYDLNGETIIRKLKQRRNDLTRYARELYLFLSKNVNIIGTDEADSFVINRMNDSQTMVQVFRVSKNKRELKSKIYERIFNHNETKEVRLYGLGGKDKFEITGDVKSSLTVRIVGGKGKDVFDDLSRVKKGGRRTIIYDTETGTEVTGSRETKGNFTDSDETINDFDRRAFKYDVLAPKFFGGFNPDDFILIGGGLSYTKQGFRMDPFKSRHTFLFDMAPKSSSFNFKLINEYNHILGKWDFKSTVDLSEPSFADYFYGFGNGTKVNTNLREEDSQYYRARYSQIKIAPSIRRRWSDDKHIIEFGPLFHRLNVETEDNDNKGENRFIFQYATFRDGQGFQLLDQDRNFAGGFLNYSFDNTNSPAVPTSGWRYNLKTRLLSQLGDEDSLNHR